MKARLHGELERVPQQVLPRLDSRHPCHATRPNAPDSAKVLERSRDRATWPCSRAFCRRRGVGFSDLFSLMSAPPDAEAAH